MCYHVNRLTYQHIRRRILKRVLSLAIAIVLGVNTAIAKEPENKSYDIDFPTAYELMFNNNNTIKAMVEEINVKKYKRRSAIGEYFPKVGVNATFLHFNKDIKTQVTHVKVNNTPMNVPNIGIQDKNLTLFGFTAVWNVFTGGKIIALNSAARAELAGSNLKYKSLSAELTNKLVERYYGLAFAVDVATVRKMVMTTNEEHLNDAIKMEKEGMIPKSERLHAEVAYRQAKKDYDASLKDILIVEEGLKNLIKADDVDISNVSIEPQSFLFIYNGELPSLEELKKEAVKNNPDFQQTDVQKRLAQANYRANAANYMPTVQVFAYDVAAQDNLARQLPHYGIGAGVNFMLFNGLSRYNDLKAADAMRKEVKYSTVAAKNDVESLVVKNYNELKKYREQYESTDKSIEHAQESLRCAMLAFREGYGTSLDVTDAQTTLAAIKIQRLNALYNYDKKLAEILSNIGQSDKILEYLKNSTQEKL